MSPIADLRTSKRLDKMLVVQHNYQAIFGTILGRNPRREVKQVSPGPHDGAEARVCAIGADRVAEKRLEKKMGEVLSAQGKEMSEIKSNLAALSTQMAAMMEEVKQNRVYGIEHNHEVPPPERETNRDATTVGSWDTSRGSAQSWDLRQWRNECLFMIIRRL